MGEVARGRRRHLTVVPDLPADLTAGRDAGRAHIAPVKPERRIGKAPALPEPPAPAPPHSTAPDGPPPGTTAADLRRALVDSGAPQPFINHAATFGEDVDGLFLWLRDYGPVFSERQWAADLLDHWTTFLEPDTRAFSAEQFGASFLAMYDQDGQALETMAHLLSEAAETGRPEAVAMARVFASIGPSQIHAAAMATAEQLVAAGLPDLPWAPGLGSGEWVDAQGFADPGHSEESLALQFRIEGLPYGFSLTIDHAQGGGVRDCILYDDVAALHFEMAARAADVGVPFLTYSGTQAGNILDAALTAPSAAMNPEQDEHVHSLLPLLRSREHLVSRPTELVSITGPRRSGRHGATSHRPDRSGPKDS